MEKLQCRHAGFPIFAAPLISDRFRELTNSKTAVGSDTLTRSDYARFDNGNPSTALPWSFSHLCSIYAPAPRATHAHKLMTKYSLCRMRRFT